MEFNRKFPWEDEVYQFRTNLEYIEIKIRSKIYKILKEIEYLDHGRWKPYASAFSVDNSREHKGFFTAFLDINRENELETLISEDNKPDERLMLETQRKAIRIATYNL